MAELKTKITSVRPHSFVKTIEDEEKRKDSLELISLLEDVTGEKPKMWGSAIIGFGKYHYESTRSTQKGDWPLIAFSPRKQNLTIYIMPGFKEYALLLKDLGKFKTSVSCLYIKRLSDVHIPTLKKLMERSYRDMKRKYSA